MSFLHRQVWPAWTTFYYHLSYYSSRIIRILFSLLARPPKDDVEAGSTTALQGPENVTASPPTKLEACEQCEAFADTDGELVFHHTRVILRAGDQYYYANTSHRYDSTSEVDPLELDPIIPIPTSKIWPLFPTHLTQVSDPLPQDCYVKRPNLLYYDDTETSTNPSDLVLSEAQVCEILRVSPHPNIAQYLGCLVEKGRIMGLCFTKYDMNLSQRVKDSRPFDIDYILQNIERGLSHLHSLGLIHCDLNPSNILMDRDNPVIGDFDSCQREGQRLGTKAGTFGWTSDDFKFALPENDEFGLLKIQEFLVQVKNVERLSTLPV